MEKAGKLKRIPFADRAAMKKAADPVMAEYAKEIGADGHLQQDQLDVVDRSSDPAEATQSSAGLFLSDVSARDPGERMRKFITGYYRLLNWLLVATRRPS